MKAIVSKARGMHRTQNREAEFLARITAGTTHEIRNVLAIIKESAGLMEDMVSAVEQGRPLEPDRLTRSLNRIGAQVDRGAELMSALNRFAHSLDHVRERTDLHQEASHVAVMCGRLARQMGHRVEAREGKASVGFTVNRMTLEMSLFAGVECCLEQLPEHGTLVMASGRQEGTPTLDFVCEVGDGITVPPPDAAPGWSRFVEMLRRMGATVETEAAPCYFRLSFPSEDEG